MPSARSDLSHYWAGDTSAGMWVGLGMYMSGFFRMMLGIAGAVSAMVQTAKNKKVAIGLVVSAAICAFVHVTEPFEFGSSPMFLCFPCAFNRLRRLLQRHLHHQITYHPASAQASAFSARCQLTWSSASLPAAAKTWMIIPLFGALLGSLMYPLSWCSASAITKSDLKTPGRERMRTREG